MLIRPIRNFTIGGSGFDQRVEMSDFLIGLDKEAALAGNVNLELLIGQVTPRYHNGND
jgi:hypothetical protein